MTENHQLADTDGILVRLVSQAVERGASALEIEYNDGQEEVCAMIGSIGFGIASLPAAGDEAYALRKLLSSLGRKSFTLTIAGQKRVKLTVQTSESFGETAYRITLHEHR